MRGGDQWPYKLYHRHSMDSKNLCCDWYTGVLKINARLHDHFWNFGFFSLSIWCVFLVSNRIGFPIQIDRFFFSFDSFSGTFYKLTNLFWFLQSVYIVTNFAHRLKTKVLKLYNTLKLFQGARYTHWISYAPPKIQNCLLNLSN